MAKVFEAGLAAEPIQFGEPTLTQNSSATDVDQAQAKVAGHDADHTSLSKVPTPAGEDVEKVASIDAEKGAAPPPAATGNEATLMFGIKLYLVFAAMMLGVFMFALDQSIVATAIPVFTSEFRAFEQVGWVVSGYFLTQCGLILLAGQLLTILKAKWVLLVAFFFFELGSLICAVAKGMTVMIVGRAIQGVGAAAMFSSMMIVITMITRVEQRPAFLASFGFVFVISSVAGPLLGGVFTQHVSWRWCFWINLPVGGLAAGAVTFLLPAHPVVESAHLQGLTMRQKLAGLDYLGSVMILGIVTCLLMALSDGGNKYAWSNWRIILEFVLAGVLIIVFAFWQVRQNERALVPLRVLKNRTVISASVAIFMTMMVMLGITYQLPLYYEAVKHHSPTKAGIDIIPAMLSVCVGIFISGGATQATGRYYPWLLIGPPFAAVGSGLLSTVTAHTSGARLIGWQILTGFGIGFSFQNILLSVQAEFATRPSLLPQAVGVSNAAQLLGGAIGVGLVNTVQSIYLNKELRAKAPDVPFEVVRQSVTAIYTAVPESQRGPVIDAYVAAITRSFLPIYIAVSIAFVASIFVRNHNLKEKGGANAAAL